MEVVGQAALGCKEDKARYNKSFEFIVDYTANEIEGFLKVDDDTPERCLRVIKRIDTKDMVDKKPAKDTVRYLVKSNEAKLTRKQFLCVRDYLIVKLGLENGKRPGPLETAKVRDFERVKKKG